MRYLALITLLIVSLAQPVAAQLFEPDLKVGWEAMEADNFREAIRHFKPLAEQGNARAQEWLGNIYGHEIYQYRTATYYWRLAAKQGRPSAQYNLGISYFDGEGVQEDFVAAYVWLSLSMVKNTNRFENGSARKYLNWLKDENWNYGAGFNKRELKQVNRLLIRCRDNLKSCTM